MSRTTAPRRSATVPAAGVLKCVCLAAVALLGLDEGAPFASAQTAASTAPGLTAATRAKLDRRVSLTLPGVPLREALMSVREVAGLNLVVSQELAGTVDMSFRDAPVHEVLDTLLLSRGLGYRAVGDGLVVVPIADLGAGNPLLASEVFATPSVDPSQLLPIVQEMLSPEGRVHAMAAGRALVAFDYPSRLAAIRAQVDRLDAAAAANTVVLDRRAAATRGAAPGGRPGAGPGPEGVAVDSAVIRLQHVPAVEMATALVPLLGETGRVSAMGNEDRLLVVDTPANLLAIRNAVAKLDVPRVQVRIRALIYDCAVEDSRRLGLNWNGGLRGRGFAADGSPLRTLAFSGVTAAGVVSPTAAGGLAIAQSASQYLDLGSTLKALNESSDSRLLADPNVVVLNHERADIKIVTEVPFQELTQSALGGAIGTTAFREAGVRLEVTPHIAPDGTVTMQVHPEFSVLSGFTPDSNAPIIDTREATTTVRIANRETLVLGGLRQRSKVKSRSSLPLLGSIPLLGRLFRNQDFETRESELLVFLTPEIVGPTHSGDCRETGIAVFGRSELEASPLCPVPMGAAAALREDRCAWGQGHFDGVESGGAIYDPGCDLPPGVFAAPAVDGLIAPQFGPHESLPPAPAPARFAPINPAPATFAPIRPAPAEPAPIRPAPVRPNVNSSRPAPSSTVPPPFGAPPAFPEAGDPPPSLLAPF